MSVAFTDSCETVRSQISSRLSGPFTDPHNGGTYSQTSATDDKINGKRVTGDAKYTDKMDFTFATNGEGCSISACSESQVMSVIDYSTNYCNLHNLYDGLTFTESYDSCSQHDTSACVVAPKAESSAQLRGAAIE